MEEIGTVAAIKRYFETDGGKKIKMEEMQALSKDERDELGALCAAALGATIKKAA